MPPDLAVLWRDAHEPFGVWDDIYRPGALGMSAAALPVPVPVSFVWAMQVVELAQHQRTLAAGS